MLRKLRIKFIAVSMLSVIIVLAILIGTINVFNYRNIVGDADSTLKEIAENGGTLPIIERGGEMPQDRLTDSDSGTEQQKSEDSDSDSEEEKSDSVDLKSDSEGEKRDPEGPDSGAVTPPAKPEDYKGGMDDHRRAEMPFDTRYFSFVFDEDGNVTGSNLENVAAISETNAKKYADQIYSGDSSKGFKGNYRYIKLKSGTKTVIAFMDCYRSMDNFRSFLTYSIGISLVGLIAVFLLVLLLSGRVMRPVAESYEKQKRFITDAGHELKTPLTVIDADVTVQEMDTGKTEWLTDIKKQTAKLTELTNDLIFLSKMDEGRKPERLEFPISDVARETAEEFKAKAKVEEKEFIIDIEPGISYEGDEKMIRELISVLIDNAIKYSSEHGEIITSMNRLGNGVKIRVINPVDGITGEQVSRMFDRFYRADESRNAKTGGYGLGLSIAKAVCEAHSGSIKANTRDGMRVDITAILA